MVDLFKNEFINKFFDKENNYILATDENGNPILKDFLDIYDYAEDVPYNQMPNVTKIFNLKPAKVGLLFAGIASIGGNSINNIVEEFIEEVEIKNYLKNNYTIDGISRKFYNFVKKKYDKIYKKSRHKPSIEILVSGFSKKHREPEVKRIKMGDESKIIPEIKRGYYNVAFGGQYDVIQRVAHGIDFSGFEKYYEQCYKTLVKYHDLITEVLKKQKKKIKIPPPLDFKSELSEALNEVKFNGLSAELHNFSEQAAIDLVDFLVDIMIKSQQFSSILPTVGGDIHIALITKARGFKWISKEEYKYKDYQVAKND